ncbi:MAG: 2-dehydro-3-deoxygalactonokinase [Proteobacteria bacterium]|nr:2-dehydro-3-deoxygalactonokinase [Pseudomonadota bacterium]
MTRPVLIGVDWGTTSARAYQVADDGSVIASRTSERGIQRLGTVAFGDALAELLGDWASLPLHRMACGMIGSRQGWVEAPYVDAPTSLRALAGRLAVTPDGALTVVPGVLARDASGVPDVMRGEETEVFGALDAPQRSGLYVLPGTHSKWVHVEQGAIAEFCTFMTGEMYAVMLAHSILGRLATDGAGDADAAFARGVARGVGAGTITHDLFSARTLALTGELAGDDVREYLSGMMIGREVRSGRIWAQGAGHDASEVTIVGADDLARRYALAFAAAGVRATRAAAGTAARGLLRIAQAAGMVG